MRPQILERHRPDISKHNITRVSFNKFIPYIVEQFRDNQPANIHWQMYHDGCLPCTIKYDYKAKLETADDDVKRLLPRLSNVSYTFLKPGLHDKNTYS